jgi:hypothetical protein
MLGPANIECYEKKCGALPEMALTFLSLSTALNKTAGVSTVAIRGAD